MKTIAITIDEPTLDRVDRLVNRSDPACRNRSKIIRAAVRDYLLRKERDREEQRELMIYRKNRDLLGRQAAALVGEQAEP